MDFSAFRDALLAKGYADETADAKIAHDIVLKAIADSGFHDNLTVKGGVVMSGITGLARRATMDMDVDFLNYPLTNEAIRRFVSRLNRAAPCSIRIRGSIETLRQHEYKGKRVHLALADGNGDTIETKVDIGVHTRDDVPQTDFSFVVVSGDGTATLLVNKNEQILAEKLKSLLRFGAASTRFKDIFDIYYLLPRIDQSVFLEYLRLYVFDDPKMRENSLGDVLARLKRIFGNGRFMRGLSNPVVAWLDVRTEDVVSGILTFLEKPSGSAP